MIASKLESYRKLATDVLVDSLRPGTKDALRARPDGTLLNGHHRIKVLRERGFDVDSLPRELVEAKNAGIEFVSFPIEDRGVPRDRDSFAELAQNLAAGLNVGQNIGVHCRQAIGRSGLLVAAVLLAEGIELGRVLKLAATARGLAVPETPEQRRWIEEYARRHSALTR